MAEDLVAADLVEPLPEPFGQRNFVLVNLVQSRFRDVLDAGRQAGDAEDVGRAAFEEVGKLARLRLARRIAAGAAFAPGCRPWRAGRRRERRCRSGPAATCGPGTPAGRCCIAWMSIGTTPAVWAASTRNSRSRSRAIRPTSAIGWTVPSTLLACVRAISRVFGVIALRMASGIDGAAAVGLQAGQA